MREENSMNKKYPQMDKGTLFVSGMLTQMIQVSRVKIKWYKKICLQFIQNKL